MFMFLLIIHVLAVICWLGGAIYERLYIVRVLEKAKETELEVPLYRMMLSTVPFFASAVLIILVTGITMTIMGNFNFFDWSWLGIKQYMMIAILIIFVGYIGPQMIRLGKNLEEDLEHGKGVTKETRSHTNRIILFVDLAHLGVLFNVILAVGKFI